LRRNRVRRKRTGSKWVRRARREGGDRLKKKGARG
jgi:hypothetical protein